MLTSCSAFLLWVSQKNCYGREPCVAHMLAAFQSHCCPPGGSTGLWHLGVSLYEQPECVGFGALKLTSLLSWTLLPRPQSSLLLHLSILCYPIQIETQGNHFYLYLGNP